MKSRDDICALISYKKLLPEKLFIFEGEEYADESIVFVCYERIVEFQYLVVLCDTFSDTTTLIKQYLSSVEKSLFSQEFWMSIAHLKDKVQFVMYASLEFIEYFYIS